MKMLQFSGGLDSLATLFVLRDEWPDLIVAWCDTHASYPETLELFSRIEQLPIKECVRVHSDQPAWLKVRGFPADVVPVRATALGQVVHKTTGPRFQSYMECCAMNIWMPLTSAVRRHGITRIYRGQRDDEKKTSPIRSGHVEDGITYIFPIATWTREEVRKFCEIECPDLIPEYYYQGEDSSRDCWDCTAYLEDNRIRISRLDTHRRDIVRDRLMMLNTALVQEQRYLQEALYG